MSERRSYISEVVVICLDCSSSMFRTNYEPHKFQCSRNILKKLIKERLQLDENSTFAVIKFSNKAEKVLDFTNIIEDLYIALDSIAKSGRGSNLEKVLSMAINLIITELRKTIIKSFKILIISDGNYTKSAIDPLKIAQVARNLNIKIDTLKIGDRNHLNIMKELSKLTKGRYYYFSNDIQSLIEFIHNIAKSNIKKHDSNSELALINPKILRNIAKPLLKVQDRTKDQFTRINQIRGTINFDKCLICHSEKEPSTKGSFYLTGRYCPNCKAPFHIHCLALWAESQKENNLNVSGIFRCPQCSYLLRIPTNVIQAQKLKILSTPRTKNQTNSQQSKVDLAELINISSLDEEAIYDSCPICNNIFEERQNLVQCRNLKCNTLYHIECFQKLKNGQCKNCGANLKF